MNPLESGVFIDVVAGVKYGAMLRAVSGLTATLIWLLVVPSAWLMAVTTVCELSVLPFDVTEHPCNPNPARIIKPTAVNNVLRLIFIVNLYNVYDRDS